MLDVSPGTGVAGGGADRPHVVVGIGNGEIGVESKHGVPHDDIVGSERVDSGSRKLRDHKIALDLVPRRIDLDKRTTRFAAKSLTIVANDEAAGTVRVRAAVDRDACV